MKSRKASTQLKSKYNNSERLQFYLKQGNANKNCNKIRRDWRSQVTTETSSIMRQSTCSSCSTQNTTEKIIA